jgi:L-glyceraldehyde 3-phosphate reductase
MVRQGKALYIGISNYPPDKTEEIYKIFKKMGTPFIIHQACYNMLNRVIENGLTDVLIEKGIGCAAYSPLAQGVLTDRYLQGIPDDSRVRKSSFLKEETVKKNLGTVRELSKIAEERGQTIAETALSWILNNPAVTTVIVGASRPSQLQDNLKALDNLTFPEEELKEIDNILKSKTKY